MTSQNPFAEFRCECQSVLKQALNRELPQVQVENLPLSKPSNPNFGQLASSVCFELAKKLKQKPADLANKVSNAVDLTEFKLISKVAQAGGYVNFYVDFAKFTALTIESISELGDEYGFVKTDAPKRTIVEHTSVNPLHPIHIGQARNPMLGDAIARILTRRGHNVSRHYYVDDVGRQSSVIAYGYAKLGKPEPTEKVDLYIGKIYTLTSCLVEINRLKRQLTQTTEDSDKTAKLNKELSEWTSIAAELQQKHPELFAALAEKIGEDQNPEEEINKLNRAYEKGEAQAKALVREVSDMCLEGFRQTQSRVEVFYDSWDWESDFVWSNQVGDVLGRLQETAFVYSEDGVLEFDAQKVVETLDLRGKLGLREDHEITPLTLVRGDGTTLYTTRDVAYTLWKFSQAQKVINVIGMEQSLAQLQLKIALYALGYGDWAENFVHFAYNLVTLPGYKMSSRRGHYITFDEVLDEAVERAFQEVSKRSPQLTEEEKREIANFVGTGAVRYALVDVDPGKPVVFTWDRVLNFETNSAPYVQYTHARACSILRKAPQQDKTADCSLLQEKLETELVLTLASFPDVFIEAAEYLKPNTIADYSNALADKFNTLYNALPVIKAATPELAQSRLQLTQAIKTVLSNALNLIGITAPEKM
ncbi:MAG: arginine--tRNA ligase [Candidatus Bathyarchaeota archaeon]|nr:arginine--tRNA ligase [Candidatus Bathyarchaeota archaeon]